MRCVFPLVALCLFHLAASSLLLGAETEQKPPGIVEGQLATRVDLKFGPGEARIASGQEFLRNFKLLTPGGFTTGRDALTLQPKAVGPLVFLRPVYSGTIARWGADLRFPPLNDGDSSTTKLLFVLGNRQQVVVSIHRDYVNDKPTARLESHLINADRADKLLRDLPLDAKTLNGVWEVAYHHGLVRVFHDDKLVLSSFARINPNTTACSGVGIQQSGSEVHIVSLTLLGAEQPEKPSGERLAAIREAQLTTRKAAQAYAAGEFAEAAVAAEESVAMWKTAKGDNSLDAANAALNMATVRQALNDNEKTIQAFEMVLRIRKKSLGDQHPLTAQVQLELARQLSAAGKGDKSREFAKAAGAVFSTCFGDSHESTKAAQRLATE